MHSILLPDIINMSGNLIAIQRGGIKMTANSATSTTCTKKTYTVQEVAQMLDISMTSAYSFIREKHFKAFKIGRTIRISKQSFDEWLENQDF